MSTLSTDISEPIFTEISNSTLNNSNELSNVIGNSDKQWNEGDNSKNYGYKFILQMFLKNNGTNEWLEILEGPKDWIEEEENGSSYNKEQFMIVAMRKENEKTNWLSDYRKEKIKAEKICSAGGSSFQYLWIIQMIMGFLFCI